MFKSLELISDNDFLGEIKVFSLPNNKHNIAFIATAGKQTILFKFHPQFRDKLQIACRISEKSPVKFIFKLGDDVFKISEDGSLYQLECSMSSTSSSSECFIGGSTSSSSFEGYTWRLVKKLEGRIVSTVGIRDSLVYIATDCGISYIKGATLTNSRVCNESSHRISTTEGDFWMKSVRGENLSRPFMKHLCGAMVVLDPDLVVMAQDNGVVSVVVVGPNIPPKDPISIHWENFDNRQLVFMDAMPSVGLVLIYNSGKVVIISYCTKSSQLRYHTYYLSQSVKAAAISKSNDTFRIIVSDGNYVRITHPISDDRIEIQENLTSLRGVVEFFPLLEDRLGCLSVNGNFYEISPSFLDEIPLVPCDSFEILKQIKTIGEAVDKLKTQVDDLSNKIEGLHDQRIDSSLIRLSVEEECLKAENTSNRSFAKNIWSLGLRSLLLNGKWLSKSFQLDEFASHSSITLPLDYFLDAGCRVISVDLVGRFGAGRRIICPLGDVRVESN